VQGGRGAQEGSGPGQQLGALRPHAVIDGRHSVAMALQGFRHLNAHRGCSMIVAHSELPLLSTVTAPQ